MAFAQKEQTNQEQKRRSIETENETTLTTSGKKQIICKRCGEPDHTSVNCNEGSYVVAAFRAIKSQSKEVSQLIHGTVKWDDENDVDEGSHWSFLLSSKV